MKARLQEGVRRKGHEEQDAKRLLRWGCHTRDVEGSEEKQTGEPLKTRKMSQKDGSQGWPEGRE